MTHPNDSSRTSPPAGSATPGPSRPGPRFRLDAIPGCLALVVALVIIGVLAILFGLLPPGREGAPAAANLTPEPWPTVVTATPSPTSTPVATVTPTATPRPTATATLTPTPTPIVSPVQVRELGYLTTVAYKMQTIVEVSRPSSLPLVGDERVLMLVVGTVQAGVDLTRLADDDITIKGDEIRLRLPQAEVVSVELNLDELEIYDSRRRWLFSDYEGLEIEALGKAQDQLEGWAVNQAGVLELAETLARHRLSSFLYQLGFRKVVIEFKPAAT